MIPSHPLLELLFSRLKQAERRALTLAISEADARAESLYLVGGSVRDLLLGRPQLDLDLALEGDALRLAERLASALSARATLHRRFGTAVLRGPDFALDLACTRSETYHRPGALPTVRPATISQDLARRDFTVNAVALCLSGPAAEQLLDPHGGRLDLERRRLRVLHSRSFQDDATRILRGLRYEARLGFRLDRGTLALVRRDLSYLDTISGARLRRELLALCDVEQCKIALARAQALGILRAIHPALSWDGRRHLALQRLRDWQWASEEAYLCLLAAAAGPGERGGLLDRLALDNKRVVGMAASVKEVAALPDPVGRVVSMWTARSKISGVWQPNASWWRQASLPAAWRRPWRLTACRRWPPSPPYRPNWREAASSGICAAVAL